MNGKSQNLPEMLVKELIFGFGFLEGLWIHFKINPLSEIVLALSKLAPEGMFSFWWFNLIMILLAIAQILLVYQFGGVIGWLALLLAFLGGIFIEVKMSGIILIIIAFFLGLWAFSMKPKLMIKDAIEFFRSLKE